MNKNYIIFSSLDWSENHWQMHQQLTTSLLNDGHRVLFIENTGVRSIKIRDFKRFFSRLIKWFKSVRGFAPFNNNLTIFTIFFAPVF